MNKENELPKRKPTRLRGFDYNKAGAYFITICTENRRQLLSSVIGAVRGDVLDAPSVCPQIKLKRYGMIADKYIKQLSDHYEHITVDYYVIMPNHVHMILSVGDHGASRTSPPTKQHSSVSRFVSTFKRFCNKEYGTNIWQRHFYDHIIRDREDYENHAKYVYENPLRWYYDELFTEE